jgi:hypothetical protein
VMADDGRDRVRLSYTLFHWVKVSVGLDGQLGHAKGEGELGRARLLLRRKEEAAHGRYKEDKYFSIFKSFPNSQTKLNSNLKHSSIQKKLCNSMKYKNQLFNS